MNLDLKAPVLQFDAANKNECILNMKIEKGSYKVDNPSRPTSEQILPENVLVLLAHVPLSAVMGTIKDGALKNTKKFSASQIIALMITNLPLKSFWTFLSLKEVILIFSQSLVRNI